MKKAILISLLALSPVAASAVELSSGSVTCLTKRYLIKYESHVTNNEEYFRNDMIDRAQCYIPAKAQKVAVIKQRGTLAKVELPGGQKVYTRLPDNKMPIETIEAIEPAEGAACNVGC